MNPPKFVLVSEQEATSIVALGAAAVAHSASRCLYFDGPGTAPGSRQSTRQ